MRLTLNKDDRPREHARPFEPDEVDLADEPQLESLRLRELSLADWKAVLIRAAKSFLADNAMLLASALAYSAFFAIPSTLLVVVGMFTLVAGPSTIASFIQHLHGVLPAQATQLLGQSLSNLEAHPASGVVMTVVGFALALWSTTGAMNAFMIAVNMAYGREDRRSFVKKRLVALKMVVVMGLAFVLVAVLLIFGPQVEHLLASHMGPAGHVLDWLWWVVQWPILLIGLLAAFSTMLYLAPDVDHLKWQFITPGSLVAALAWIATSGLFAVYTSTFGSYNKTWGTLSAVIVMLTWLWLSSMALLFGAEVNAEVERSARLRSA
jgi:membrane protein